VHRLSAERQQKRDRVLESLQKRQARQATAAATAPAAAGASQSQDGTMADKTGKMGEVIKILNHELIPMIRQCYDDALTRAPHLHGMLALQMKVASAEGVGSIFEAVEPDATNQIPDPDFIECVRQSAFTIDLPPPKADSGNDFLMTIPFEADAGTR
jgi:hypothetical protein